MAWMMGVARNATKLFDHNNERSF